jgi:DNA-binding NarL/FixJ family response regulator
MMALAPPPGPENPIRVLIVDDQELLRLGFRMILDAEPDIEVVGEADDGTSAVRRAGELRPDVVLMDVRMPGMDGIAATEAIVASGVASKVLILTTFDLDQYVYAGLRAGASGFLLKDVPPSELISAIRSVAAGDAVIAPGATRRLLDSVTALLPDPEQTQRQGELLSSLTEREREVFFLVATGASNAEVAAGLHLSEGTVKVHVGRILAKFELRDRVQIVVLGYESGLITPGG